MVGYALLVVIAIGLAAIVYPFLKARLPVERVECPADLSLSIDDVSCNRADHSLTIKLLNRGLFNVTGAYIRFAESDRTVRPQVNPGKEIYLTGLNPTPLGPGQYTPYLTYPIGNLTSLPPNGTFIVEVQAAIFKKGVLVPCANKIITQTINCVSTLIGWMEDDTGDEYGCEGDWHSLFSCNNVNDTNWETFGTANQGLVIYYVNYTTPPNAIWPNSNWTVKWGNQEIDSYLELGPCWNEVKMQFKIEIDHTPIPQNEKIALFCMKADGSGWQQLDQKIRGLSFDVNATNLYEEKMWWQLRS